MHLLLILYPPKCFDNMNNMGFPLINSLMDYKLIIPCVLFYQKLPPIYIQAYDFYNVVATI